MVANSILSSVSASTNRLVRLATVLVDMHLDIAMREAAWEKKRLTSGFILLSIGGGLLVMTGLLLQAIAVWFFESLLHSWIGALAVVAGIDTLMGAIFLIAASRKLRGPYMVQTQARLARTATTLMQNEPSEPL